jgi:hypothetical protein
MFLQLASEEQFQMVANAIPVIMTSDEGPIEEVLYKRGDLDREAGIAYGRFPNRRHATVGKNGAFISLSRTTEEGRAWFAGKLLEMIETKAFDISEGDVVFLETMPDNWQVEVEP